MVSSMGDSTGTARRHATAGRGWDVDPLGSTRWPTAGLRTGTTDVVTRPGLPRTLTDDELNDLIARLDLPAKVHLLTGASTWALPGEPRIGLRAVVFSDGPVGVRGTGDDRHATSVLLPSPTALAATWDPELAAEVGRLFAVEARRHGVDVVLAPLVNLQRTPVAGRHFESLSEDPLLTARMGTALVQGVQDLGVGVCLKHFVANNSETARTQYVAQVAPEVLRATEMVPFEDAVRRAHPASIMAAYNGVDDGTESAPMTEHHHLLVDVLKDEWGFEGPVVSDWAATRSTAASANGGLDIVMPGPDGPWGEALIAAVRRGEVPESSIDDKVRRVLVLADRVGALASATPPMIDEAGPNCCGPVADDSLPRRVAATAMVVLRTSGTHLPVADAPASIALIGPNAVDPFYLGGGSAQVTPDRLVTPEQGLARAFPGARITLARGVDGALHAPDLDPRRITDPTGRPGVRLTQLGADGAVLASATVAWTGTVPHLAAGAETIRIEARVDLPEPGTHRIGLGHVGTHRLSLDGHVVEDVHRDVGDDVVVDSSINHPGTTLHDVEGGRVVAILGEFPVVHTHWGNVARAFLRHRVPQAGDDRGIAQAVRAADDADLTVMIVGTNEDVESEGWDRTGLDLPGRQDELVEAVLDVDPEAVVVVNAGGPVLLPWLDRARTVVWAWLPGQDFGDALGDILSGRLEPSGRLPWTLPARAADVPVPDAIPNADGRLVYAEGLDVGYRAYAGPGAPAPTGLRPVPSASFGHGLGWTTWEYSDLVMHPAGGDTTGGGGVLVTLTVTNTGPRPGRETIQVYASRSAGDGADVGLPTQWLAGFAQTTLEPGARGEVRILISGHAFQAWRPGSGWTLVPGAYRLHVGRSSGDIRLSGDVVVGHGA